MIGFLFVSTTYLYGTLLTANNNLRQLNMAAAITVVINIAMNLILIPRYQARGAAIASLVSQGFFAITQWFLAIHLLNISWNADIMIRLLGFLAINLAVGYLSLLIPGWIPGFVLLLASCVICAILLGLIRLSEFLAILNE
jgi:O-antigen/teichoic acid export membrane protein